MKKTLKLVLARIARYGLWAALMLAGFSFLLTGWPFPIFHIESLKNPDRVRAWSGEGLVLSDGRTLKLPGVHALPRESGALTELTKRGVEIAPDGRIYCLAGIHHWCGNDPVRKDVQRVDLSAALQFLHVGESDAPPTAAEETARRPGGQFSTWGWNISEYYRFLSWQRARTYSREEER